MTGSVSSSVQGPPVIVDTGQFFAYYHQPAEKHTRTREVMWLRIACYKGES